MGFPWNWRRTTAQEGGIPAEPVIVGLVLSEMFSAFGREQLNQQRMMSCTMIWTTGTAAVGVCPGYDDFLVWLNPQTEPLT